MRTGPKGLVGLGSPASFRGPLAALSKGGGGALPGFGFLRIGSPGSSQLVRVGSDSSSPRIQIPTGA